MKFGGDRSRFGGGAVVPLGIGFVRTRIQAVALGAYLAHRLGGDPGAAVRTAPRGQWRSPGRASRKCATGSH